MTNAVPPGVDQGSSQPGAPQQFWRTLAEQADEAALVEKMAREFPQLLPLASEAPNRRQFLTLMGASLALAGLAGCDRRPAEKIVPYVYQPEQIVPGRPLYYATASLLDGYARGVLVESHMGRPTKLEGNPQHPASLGAADVFMQAECLTLYDPDRTQTVFQAGEISTWDHLLSALQPVLQRLQASGGAGLRLLTGSVTSPTLVQQISALLEQYPQSRWHSWQPLGADSERAGARLAWGEEAAVMYRFDRADVVVALDADFLAPGPAGIRYARDFMNARRRPGQGDGPPRMNRLYVVESTLSLAGAYADHRLPLSPAAVGRFALELARRLGVDVEAESTEDESPLPAEWLEAIAADLTGNRPPGTTLVLAGPHQPPVVHALAHAMNGQLGNIGQTVLPIAPIVAGDADQLRSLSELVADMKQGAVELLVMLDTNPAYTAPADLEFDRALEQVELSIRMGLYYDETSELCDWHVPAAHALESWADARAFDGTVTILQPLIAPLYNSKSPYEMLAALAGHPEQAPQDLVREYWQGQWGDQFAERWAVALHDGYVEGSASEPLDVSLQPDWPALLRTLPAASAGIDLVFRPDPTLWDGCFANNGWLQELPKPFSKLTWDNAALIGPATARRLGLENETLITLSHQSRQLEAAVWITAGIPENTVTMYLGGGRRMAGKVASGRGFDTYRLRTSEHPGWVPDVQLQKTGRRYPLVCTQEHHLLEGRDLIRAGTLAEWEAHPEHPEFMSHLHDPHEDESLFPHYEYHGYKWGMSIDVGACIGCNACVVACQSENNIPVVGKDQVANGREMHWIRIDTYYTGEDTERPRTYHQPLPCMHCEHAPCELVCPVAATVHSSEGLNQMVYNRCVGTRYCSNNCPYKVRRFNFLEYNDRQTPVLEMLRNPDVTVRSLGVMEKCTYCTQRISAARIEAEKENRTIEDGEVVTACQQACPTTAIVFGDLNQLSRVRQLQESPLDYGLLVELNTRPRTRYLAAVKNMNPALNDKLS